MTVNPSAEARRILRKSEAAEMLFGEDTRANRQKIDRLIATGDLRAIEVGPQRQRRVVLASVDELLARS
jgi:hypothetical protein